MSKVWKESDIKLHDISYIARDNENTKFITTSMSDYKGHTTNSSSLSPTAINQQKRKSNITFGKVFIYEKTRIIDFN